MTLEGEVALVAGATRGAGRGIAVELGAAGATVYVTGRTTRDQRSEYARPETIEQTAELVSAAGGHGIAVIYQELSLSPNLTVAENIYLGREIRRGIFADRKAMQARCRGILGLTWRTARGPRRRGLIDMIDSGRDPDKRQRQRYGAHRQPRGFP